MKKKLTKSSNNIVITGTLAGIADWLGMDPTVIRIIFAGLSFWTAGFPGITLYIILAMIIPSAPRKKQYNPYYHSNRTENPERKEADKIDEDDWSDF